MQSCFSILMIACLLSCAGLPAEAAQRNKATEAVRLLVDNECPLPPTPALPGLHKRVKRLLRVEQYGMHGDVAFPYDLNGDRKSEYIVMLNCSAVGNCNWAVFSLWPIKFLGGIYGKDLLLRERRGPWATITTYGHVSASDGVLTNFCRRGGRYAKCGEERTVSAQTKNYPAFLKQRPVNCPKQN